MESCIGESPTPEHVPRLPLQPWDSLPSPSASAPTETDVANICLLPGYSPSRSLIEEPLPMSVTSVQEARQQRSRGEESSGEGQTQPDDEEDVQRFVMWCKIDRCPKCGGADVHRYQDYSTDKYVARCKSVPRSVLNELDALCSGTVYKPPARSKTTGQIPLSHQVSTAEEYVERVQDVLCGWHVEF